MEYIESLKHIEKVVCECYGVDPKTLYEDTKAGSIPLCRQTVWALARFMYGNAISCRELGEMYNRDHSTVYLAIKQVNNRASIDRAFAYEYDRMMDLVRNSPILTEVSVKGKLRQAMQFDNVFTMRVAINQIIAAM